MIRLPSRSKEAVKTLLRRVGLQVSRLDVVWGVDLESDVKRLVGPDRQGPLFLDVGANEGQTAAWLFGLYPGATVHSLEPSSTMFPKLQASLGGSPRAFAWKLGAGEATETKRFNVYENECLNSLLSLNRDAQNPFREQAVVRVEEIEVVRLDDFVARQNIAYVDLLKVDTQGYDYEVLRGASGLFRDKRVGSVLLETNFAPLYERQHYFEDFLVLMREAGYGLVGLYGGSRKDGVIQWADALFTCVRP